MKFKIIVLLIVMMRVIGVCNISNPPNRPYSSVRLRLLELSLFYLIETYSLN